MIANVVILITELWWKVYPYPRIIFSDFCKNIYRNTAKCIVKYDRHIFGQFLAIQPVVLKMMSLYICNMLLCEFYVTWLPFTTFIF